NGVLVDQDLGVVPCGQRLDLAQQCHVGRRAAGEVIGDAGLAPDDQVRPDPAERAVLAQLGGQRLARVGPLCFVVYHAGLDQRDRDLADGGKRRRERERQRPRARGGDEDDDARGRAAETARYGGGLRASVFRGSLRASVSRGGLRAGFG